MRRLRWIAWSLRHEVRPQILADLVRAHGGHPPPIPWNADGDPCAIGMRPGDRALLTAGTPGVAEARSALASADSRGVRILTQDDAGWMARLWTELPDPPVALYVRGELHPVDEAAVAIVGSRYPSPNGMSVARSLARDLAREGVTIVSGLALGIDGAAHRGALDAGGRTVAVLGGGIDNPSPPSHAALAERVARSGAVVSEFPLGCHPRPLHFPRRNRILGALAHVVVVVEGAKRSGARSTVDHAIALGREVAAVPRDPVHEGSDFPNALLRSGATPVACAQDVLDLLGTVRPAVRRAPPAGLAGDRTMEDALLARLAQGRHDLGGLVRLAGGDHARILALLGRLEASGKVRRLPGMRFEISGTRA